MSGFDRTPPMTVRQKKEAIAIREKRRMEDRSDLYYSRALAGILANQGYYEDALDPKKIEEARGRAQDLMDLLGIEYPRKETHGKQ